MTCRDCLIHDICKEKEKLMLTVDNLYELIYQEAVEVSCRHFKNKADVVEVKHGEWKRKGQDIYCSVCGNESAYNPFGASKFSDYCPNCGAKMDGKE